MDGNQPSAPQSELPQPVQPGQTISPGSSPAAEPAPPAEPTVPTPTAPLPQADQPAVEVPDAPPVPPVQTPPTDVPVMSDVASFAPAQSNDALPVTQAGNVSWTASEFIAHEKTKNWYVLLFAGAIILAGLVWLIFKDWISSAVIVLAVSVLAAYSSRQPRELQYTLDNNGITIGEKHYPYGHFRSFSVIEEGAFSSIELLPLKRFSPPISVYYDPANEEAIAAALTPHLPFEPREQDAIDKLIRRIRF